MTDQIFTAPVGQVAAGDIKNHSSRWDLMPLVELGRYKKVYAQQKRQEFIGQYVNKAAALLLVVVLLFGAWATRMLQTNGLTGSISTEKWVVFVAFALGTLGACIWLQMIRARAQEAIAELNDELKKINSAIRYQKTKRK